MVRLSGGGIGWHTVTRVCGNEAAEALFALFDEATDTVSAFETAPGEWRIEAYPQRPILDSGLQARIALATVAADGTLIEVSEERLLARDWLRENQLSFPPLRIGRFFVYGSHHHGAVPAGAIGIAVDAATAFGTGEHPSTRGCLMALERLSRRRRFRGPLDVGTGTGILSIAAAKLLHRRVLATDTDPNAVTVARHNARRNGVAKLIQLRAASGYCDRMIGKSHYDLILSNILARPLAAMAADLARRLEPGGRAVLSGLLPRQEQIVLAPHLSHGIILDHRLLVDGWSTLVLRKGSRNPLAAETASFKLLSAARISPAAGRGSRVRKHREREFPRAKPRSANGAFRYRRGHDHRAPSALEKPVGVHATAKRSAQPK